MWLRTGIDMAEFLNTVQKCSDEVFFTTDEGDRLNLKSTLSQFVLVSVMGEAFQNPSWKIELEKPEDAVILQKYLT